MQQATEALADMIVQCFNDGKDFAEQLTTIGLNSNILFLLNIDQMFDVLSEEKKYSAVPLAWLLLAAKHPNLAGAILEHELSNPDLNAGMLKIVDAIALAAKKLEVYDQHE